MSSFCLLLDENLPRSLQTALWRARASAEVLRVGVPGGPPLGSSDAEVLRFAEERKALLITRDRRTMPVHIASHIAAGGTTWGVAIVRGDIAPRALVDDILLILEASTPDEWRDVTTYLPFT
jgi:Domain of unknown function (DUF5615)